ncbi:MAG: YidC/Oxa1 family membrane protein insertase [Tyzzerella sp.]|nr:YidC/Oxa1 family membrane protein insertase [Tyzzerella sp.]
MGILLTQRDGLIIGNIAKLFGFLMNGIFEVLNSIGIQNIGLCIIIFTIIIYMLMLPLTIKQQKFTRISAVMNPEIQKIQKKYQGKNDQISMQRMQEETQLVYQKYGTSPTGGCLSSLIQLPFLFALWPVVQNIPAYVNGVKEAYMPLVEKIMATDGFQKIMEAIGTKSPINISSSAYDYSKANTIIDVLYKFQEGTWDTLAEKFPDLTQLINTTEENIRNFNYFLGINIAETPTSMISTGFKTVSIGLIIAAVMIPVLAGATQWLNMKLMNSRQNQNDNKKKQEENAMVQQMNATMKFMPLMSVVLCFSMPVGLGLYWITSAVVRTIQQVVINKVLDKKPIEQLVEENIKKAAKKNANKKQVESKNVSYMAQTNARRIEEPKRKTTSNNNIDSYKPNAKPGSLAAKANMVSDYNKNKK